MMSPQTEHAAAIRSSVERLLRGAATENLEMLGLERRKLEEALGRLTSELEALRTERDDARAQTFRAELQLTAVRRILDDGPDAFLVTDSSGVIVHSNRAATQLLGVPSRFLIRKPLSLFVDEGDLRIFRSRVNRAHLRGQSEWPLRMRSRDGPPFTASVTVSAFVGGDGKTADLRWLLRDIGARQRAEELVAAQEFTNQMLESEQAARTSAESARRAAELQVRVSGLLAASLDYHVALTGIG